jgi:hypothetical protein
MIDRLILWSLAHRPIVIALAAAFLVWGGWTATRIPLDVLPDLTAPTVTILVEAPGMDPLEIETLVTLPIESALNGSVGVRRVRSATAVGVAVVWVEFDWGQDITRARQTVTEKLTLVAGSLPPGVEPPFLAPVSNLATCVDDMTFVHSMVSKSSNHTPATFSMNTGFTMNGFPCLGSWLSYGLGSENQDLPAFVVLPDPRQLPAGGAINWTSGFLPAVHQGVAFRTSGEPIVDLNTPVGINPRRRQMEMTLLDRMNREFMEANSGESSLAARIRSYELAARMQASVPETVNFEAESVATRRLYGLGTPVTDGFGRNCLLARRLLERGVRFVQLFHGGAFGSPRINWDGHEDIVENHTKQAASMDKPVAALLHDLKARGMLDDTLVIWTTEFGRTPITQGIGAKGRDHHPSGFTIWMAGAGLKPGLHYGATDEVGYFASEKPVSVYDFHATVLHLLGLDHERLTYYHNGIQRRLTDVHGHVIGGLLA